MAERRRRGFQNMETWRMIGCVKDHVFTILGPCLLRHVVFFLLFCKNLWRVGPRNQNSPARGLFRLCLCFIQRWYLKKGFDNANETHKHISSIGLYHIL
jgi:hypothetical protein